MKLREYAHHVNELAKKYPHANVIYSTDDEGNGYDDVKYYPTAGSMGNDGYFDSLENCEKPIKVTHVCIN